MEPARKRAERRWGNHKVAARFKAKKAEAKAAPLKPEDPLLIEADKLESGTLTRFERKFLKEIRQMMHGYSEQNKAQYVAALIANNEREKRILLLEKLRRLEADVARQETQK
jgi:hypothetical protein